MHATQLFQDVLSEDEEDNAENIVITEQNNHEYGGCITHLLV